MKNPVNILNHRIKDFTDLIIIASIIPIDEVISETYAICHYKAIVILNGTQWSEESS